MADVKISGLPAATTPLAGTEVLPIVQSSATKKVSIADVTAGRAVSASSLTATNLKTSPATANLDISGTTIAAGGSDANVDVNINAKGSGVAYLNQRWGVNQSGALVASAGNTYDIGNGTNNPRDVNIDRYAVMNGLTASKAVFTDASKNLTTTGTVGTTQGGTGITSFTANGVVYASSTSALATGTALTFDGKNLGINGVPSAWVSTSKALQITYTGLETQHSGATSLMSNAYESAANTWTYYDSAYAIRYRLDVNDGSHTWYSAPSGTVGNAITWTQILALNKAKTLALEGATSQSGTGITFPATQSASSDANTLDDYEEGTWTPTDGSGAGLTLTASGNYIKIGGQVTAWASITFPATADGSNVLIASFPFTPQNTNPVRGGGMIGTCDASTVARVLMSKTTTTCDFRDTSGNNIINSTMSGKSIFFATTYFV